MHIHFRLLFRCASEPSSSDRTAKQQIAYAQNSSIIQEIWNKIGQHHYYGGYVKRSPYRIPVPRSTHWYLTIDLGGYAGKVRHGVRVLSGKLPTASAQLPLANNPNLFITNILPCLADIHSSISAGTMALYFGKKQEAAAAAS